MAKIILKRLKVSIHILFLLMLLASSNTFTSNILFNNKVLATPPISASQSNYIKDRLRYHYEFIFFYNANCKYCIDFCKTLRSYAVNHKIPVTAFKLTNEGSPYFPNSTLVDQRVINQYFSTGIGETRLAVPALFILNTYNMHVYPVSRGNLTYFELTNRMNSLMQKIKQFDRAV